MGAIYPSPTPGPPFYGRQCSITPGLYPHSVLVTLRVSLCHDISIVLPGPGWRAAGIITSYSWSHGHMAHKRLG